MWSLHVPGHFRTLPSSRARNVLSPRVQFSQRASVIVVIWCASKGVCDIQIRGDIRHRRWQPATMMSSLMSMPRRETRGGCPTYLSAFLWVCIIVITFRFLFANFTSSLLIVNSTLLAFAALALLGLGGLYSVFNETQYLDLEAPTVWLWFKCPDCSLNQYWDSYTYLILGSGS